MIKVEPPNFGDPLRVWRERDVDGVSPWWRSIARNKKSVTIDMRKEEGRRYVRAVLAYDCCVVVPVCSQVTEPRRRLVKLLAAKSDVILENFKPGSQYMPSLRVRLYNVMLTSGDFFTLSLIHFPLSLDPLYTRVALEKWNLGPADLHPLNPNLIFTRVSGYGQTGPWASRPGYASVCEAESGFRFLNGVPDPETGALSGAPIRPNISLGDSVAGLHAAFGTVRHGVDLETRVLSLYSLLRYDRSSRSYPASAENHRVCLVGRL